MSKNRDFRQLSSNKSEAISNDSAALSALNIALAANTNEQSGDQDDPALVIGLAMAFAKQGQVSAVLLQRLTVLAKSGNVACSLVMDWIEKCAARDPDQPNKAEIIAASMGAADE